MPKAQMTIEYVVKSPQGMLACITSSRGGDKSYYGSFRMFVGDGATMREIPVERVTRLRDGGTTRIVTPEGVFRSPTPMFNEPTTWNRADGSVVRLELLDSTRFALEVSASGATLTEQAQPEGPQGFSL